MTTEAVARTRRATYRLQLHAGFGFDDAARIADYLAALGVSHVYASPCLQAAPGSTHGYDVVDYHRVNEELGGDAAHRRFLDAIRAAGLGLVVDVVPNHMAIGRARANRWWWDVLTHGPNSRYGRYFDVDWDSPEQRLRNVVLLPVLGDQYGRVLEAGEIRLWRDEATLTLRYHEHEFPLAPETLEPLLASAGVEPAQLAAGDAGALAALDRLVVEINATPDRLDALLDCQHYRLAWWQAAQRDLGYRRFFDVNNLIGLCAEDETVFLDTHKLVLAWVQRGSVDGLRIDHIDGLKDPEGYLRRLRAACPSCYVVVEKILGVDERLPDSWPVDGTTGYDFLGRVLGLFVDPAAEARFSEFYATFAGEQTDFAVAARAKKLLVLREALGSDVNRLAELLLHVCERHRRHRDYTRQHLTDALFELLACFPVYRTYVRPAAGQVSDADRQCIDEALRRVRAARPDLDTTLLDFIQHLLTLNVTGKLESEFVLRFQQLSAPAMARGVEDTAFYSHARYLALNEVGGDPSRFAVTPAAFHAAMIRAQAEHPASMLATDTHDTKRGEDVRARLAVLSEIPSEWISAVRRWSSMNEIRRGGGRWPDRNTEFLLYQTLVGAWPLTVERARAYMEKAVREAKVHTSWTAPDAAFESALRDFIDQTLGDHDFVTTLDLFVRPLIGPGRIVSLAQTAIKLTAPGVPDVYQGTELWSHTLVDPDNRRPVNFDQRRARLAELEGMTPEAVMARAEEGFPKLLLVRRALALRAERPEAFGPAAGYRPLEASGAHAERVVAYLRNDEVLTVIPRLTLRVSWGDTRIQLPLGRWCDVIGGEAFSGSVPVRSLLGRFPVALLARDRS